MKFKSTFCFFGKPPSIEDTDLVRAEVDAAPDYHDGHLESTVRRLERLTEIVSHIFANLPDDVKRDVAKAMAYDEVKS
jgi:hypothetical protein